MLLRRAVVLLSPLLATAAPSTPFLLVFATPAHRFVLPIQPSAPLLANSTFEGATRTTSSAASSTSSLPSVAAYTGATFSEASFSAATASAMAVNLPGYLYNLTMESEATRSSICEQTTTYCAAAGCSKANANASTNFCNPTTMGWNCDCNKGASSNLSDLVVPVNTYDCRLRTAACLDQCTNKTASPPVNSTTACRNACNYILGSTCGTTAQVIPLYQVSKYSSKPKYYAVDTTVGGVDAMGTTSTSSAFPSLVLPQLAVFLAPLVVGLFVLGGETGVLG
ncbi:hypothetical protein JCM8547_006327 [Rhodosporidiobolus lusitaniae]